MSCCGKKRESLAQFYATPVGETSDAYTPPIPRSGMTAGRAVFRYTGTGRLDIKGFLGRRIYSFTAASPQLTVAAEDAAMIRACSSLVEVKR
jgi:hypothetical protein